MIVIKLSDMMGKRKIKMKQLSIMTGIRPNTISELWHGTSKTVNVEYLDRLCIALECQPGDLFEYVQDEK